MLPAAWKNLLFLIKIIFYFVFFFFFEVNKEVHSSFYFSCSSLLLSFVLFIACFFTIDSLLSPVFLYILFLIIFAFAFKRKMHVLATNEEKPHPFKTEYVNFIYIVCWKMCTLNSQKYVHPFLLDYLNNII